MCRCVRGILRRSAWAAALAVALFGASVSKAGTLQVDYSLQGSTLMLGTLLSTANGTGAGDPAGNPGTQVTGSARLTLTGVDASGMIIDPSSVGGSISGLNLTFNLNQVVVVNGAPISGANLVGPISITQMGTATGTFAGGMVTLPTGSFTTQLATNIDLAGPLAATIKQLAAGMGITFPIVQMATIANTDAPFVFTVGSLAANSTLSATVATMNMGQAVNLNFRGAETARMFTPAVVVVPEPVESGLLILSVLSLCGVAAVRRQRVAA
jgi:hypothetical protein